ncbi:tetratricopeptide repeat protein [Aestuariibaculum sediminum]|uniref:Tetratricopeptide repeat protein n=1 Tax=Aestuariibaculum sediminum TaxID=2770637 RepID=A0A8J6QG99_9FLAO|nr:hypothetical protein [Aestuariibaculum sediminum]MBD0831474.1 hypothetical protein [Aestuariibaculum sediminum]
MKRVVILLILLCGFGISAQSNDELVRHFEAYYKQMQKQGDVQGIINGLTHLNVLAPSLERVDTLAYVYMLEGQYVQALNTIGIDRKMDDSDVALEVKAKSLKAVKQPARAIEFYEEIFKRNPSAHLAFELAELNLQTQNLTEADKHIAYGLANVKDDMRKAFYETQQPYEVSLKSAFMYLKALSLYNKDRKANIDGTLDILDATLKESPNFNLIQLTKNELLRQKQMLQSQQAEEDKK